VLLLRQCILMAAEIDHECQIRVSLAGVLLDRLLYSATLYRLSLC